jgi:5-methylcytosine-specific restriction endonuclease McrA
MAAHHSAHARTHARRLYCQLMKQTNKNPRDSSNEKGWELMALCAGCFLPQDEMLDRLYKRLEEHEQDPKVCILPHSACHS